MCTAKSRNAVVMRGFSLTLDSPPHRSRLSCSCSFFLFAPLAASAVFLSALNFVVLCGVCATRGQSTVLVLQESERFFSLCRLRHCSDPWGCVCAAGGGRRCRTLSHVR